MTDAKTKVPERTERPGAPVPPGFKRVPITDILEAKIEMINGTFTLRPKTDTYPGTLGFMNRLRPIFKHIVVQLRDKFFDKNVDDKEVDRIYAEAKREIELVYEAAGEYNTKMVEYLMSDLSQQQSFVKTTVKMTPNVLEIIADMLQNYKNHACDALIICCAEKLVPETAKEPMDSA